jgi:hypothetical protein
MIISRGAQNREHVGDTGYRVLLNGRTSTQAILCSREDGKCELWIANDHHSGYTIELEDGIGYEFVTSLNDAEVLHYSLQANK